MLYSSCIHSFTIKLQSYFSHIQQFGSYLLHFALLHNKTAFLYSHTNKKGGQTLSVQHTLGSHQTMATSNSIFTSDHSFLYESRLRMPQCTQYHVQLNYKPDSHVISSYKIFITNLSALAAFYHLFLCILEGSKRLADPLFSAG
jgi:hypothetical protein